MLEIDLKAPATSANESFVAAASAAAGIAACRAVCVFAGAGQGKPGPQNPVPHANDSAYPSKTNFGTLSGNEFHKA